MLIVALASRRSTHHGPVAALHQMSVDGQFPRWFQHLTTMGCRSVMFFNVLASLLVVLLGGAVEIYTFSNVGYTGSFLPVLVGYYLLRKYKPNARRPFRLPEFMKYVALALALFYASSGSTADWCTPSWGTRDLLLPRLAGAALVPAVSTGTGRGWRIPSSPGG